MDSKIAEALAAARQVAAQLPALTQPTEVVAPPPAGRARTLDEAIDQAGVGVDVWASIDASGYRINNTIVPSFTGRIKLSEVQFPYMVRFTVGGSTKFVRSYDGVYEAQSRKPWAGVIAQAQSADPGCKGVYDAAEIPVILDKDLVVGTQTYKAGSRIGITTPVTGYKTFSNWAREARLAFGSDGEVPVTTSVEVKQKPGMKAWGIPVFSTRS